MQTTRQLKAAGCIWHTLNARLSVPGVARSSSLTYLKHHGLFPQQVQQQTLLCLTLLIRSHYVFRMSRRIRGSVGPTSRSRSEHPAGWLSKLPPFSSTILFSLSSRNFHLFFFDTYFPFNLFFLWVFFFNLSYLLPTPVFLLLSPFSSLPFPLASLLYSSFHAPCVCRARWPVSEDSILEAEVPDGLRPIVPTHHWARTSRREVGLA